MYLHSVGAFSSIASGQHIVPNGHKVDYVSTWNSLLDYKSKLPLEKSIKIGNDVWIGGHSIIRSNVTIGDGAIIGAGSVITKDVAPYTVVVGGNRVVKQRFSDNVVEALLEMEWWNWEDEKIINSIPYWSDVNEFIARYKDNGCMK